jgi:hypothetical protein
MRYVQRLAGLDSVEGKNVPTNPILLIEIYVLLHALTFLLIDLFNSFTLTFVTFVSDMSMLQQQ